ncbi:MAG: hypothetical protein GXO19_04555 [Epsilonproteobacteria bacterium]|nr:hypothetical protein [Campylobacterota bacterium]NPA56989.1 hypothetical protein [Campylobacterota bacterium]
MEKFLGEVVKEFLGIGRFMNEEIESGEIVAKDSRFSIVSRYDEAGGRSGPAVILREIELSVVEDSLPPFNLSIELSKWESLPSQPLPI